MIFIYINNLGILFHLIMCITQYYLAIIKLDSQSLYPNSNQIMQNVIKIKL